MKEFEDVASCVLGTLEELWEARKVTFLGPDRPYDYTLYAIALALDSGYRLGYRHATQGKPSALDKKEVV